MKPVLKISSLGLALATLLPLGAVEAATSIKGKNFPFGKANPSQTLEARSNSFYNLTMGYKGWTHHSTWMTMDLKKNKPYSITLDATATEGFHPAIACWYRPKGAGLVSADYAQAHFYNQFTSIIAPNQTDEDGGKKLGTIKMYFVANGFDRDGMQGQLPEEYQQGPVVGILDGESGKVTLSFVAQKSGQHQCAVGGINPTNGLDITNLYPIGVSVNGL